MIDALLTFLFFVPILEISEDGVYTAGWRILLSAEYGYGKNGVGWAIRISLHANGLKEGLG